MFETARADQQYLFSFSEVGPDRAVAASLAACEVSFKVQQPEVTWQQLARDQRLDLASDESVRQR